MDRCEEHNLGGFSREDNPWSKQRLTRTETGVMKPGKKKYRKQMTMQQETWACSSRNDCCCCHELDCLLMGDILIMMNLFSTVDAELRKDMLNGGLIHRL